MLRQIDESGRITYASKVKTLLFENGFGYAWIADEIGNKATIDGYLSTKMERKIK